MFDLVGEAPRREAASHAEPLRGEMPLEDALLSAVGDAQAVSGDKPLRSTAAASPGGAKRISMTTLSLCLVGADWRGGRVGRLTSGQYAGRYVVVEEDARRNGFHIWLLQRHPSEGRSDG